MKEIPLTQGKIALVDDEDFPELSKYRWYAHKDDNTWYAERHSPKIDGESHKIKMHRVIAGTPKGVDTDHINGDGLDNRRENLRIVTHRINQQNRHESKTSKYPGVSWDRRKRKWRADIRIGGKRRHLGLYPDEEIAGIVYTKACAALEGDTV
jgi:hypothetical protein